MNDPDAELAISSPVRRAIIVGAGASVPYGLPLAGKLLANATTRIANLEKKQGALRVDNELDASIMQLLDISQIVSAFRHKLVQQNLDDFVRDHPSLTGAVAVLIATELFVAMYKNIRGVEWERKPRPDFGSDWMRQFVGLVRPWASSDNRLHIISFNYDRLLEETLRTYWSGSETKYADLDGAVEFIYPHGRFSELPASITNVRDFLGEQAAQLRLGSNIDHKSRERAAQLIANVDKRYFVGFSFADTNVALLGLNEDVMKHGRAFVQNYKNEDIRLNRKMETWHVADRDHGDMNALVRNGFFEQ
jgi:hypothetical protein